MDAVKFLQERSRMYESGAATLGDGTAAAVAMAAQALQEVE